MSKKWAVFIHRREKFWSLNGPINGQYFKNTKERILVDRTGSRPEIEPKVDQVKSFIRQDYWWHSSGYRWSSCTSYCTTIIRIFISRGCCWIDCCISSKRSLWWSDRWTFCFGTGIVLFGQTEAFCSAIKLSKVCWRSRSSSNNNSWNGCERCCRWACCWTFRR